MPRLRRTARRESAGSSSPRRLTLPVRPNTGGLPSRRSPGASHGLPVQHLHQERRRRHHWPRRRHPCAQAGPPRVGIWRGGRTQRRARPARRVLPGRASGGRTAGSAKRLVRPRRGLVHPDCGQREPGAGTPHPAGPGGAAGAGHRPVERRAIPAAELHFAGWQSGGGVVAPGADGVPSGRAERGSAGGGREGKPGGVDLPEPAIRLAVRAGAGGKRQRGEGCALGAGSKPRKWFAPGTKGSEWCVPLRIAAHRRDFYFFGSGFFSSGFGVSVVVGTASFLSSTNHALDRRMAFSASGVVSSTSCFRVLPLSQR